MPSVSLDRLVLPLESLLQSFSPQELQVLLPNRKLLPSWRNIHYLPHVPPAPLGESHSLAALRSLDLHVDRAGLTQSGGWSAHIDLSALMGLERLELRGTMWSDLKETFVGSSASIRSCILRGPLVIGSRSERFFDRIAPGLTSLICHEVHLVSRIDTIFPQLSLLGLHRTIHATGIFPFSRSSLRTVLVELDDAGDINDTNNVVRVTQGVLNGTNQSLKTMIVHSHSMVILQNTYRILSRINSLLNVVMFDTSNGLSRLLEPFVLPEDIEGNENKTAKRTVRAHVFTVTTAQASDFAHMSANAEDSVLDSSCCPLVQRRTMLKEVWYD